MGPYTNRSVLLVFLLVLVTFWYFSPTNLPRHGSYSSRRFGGSPAWLRDGPPEVMNGTLGFEKIFVINLPARTDRRDAMALAGALTGLQLDFSPGVAGADVPDQVLPAGHAAVSAGNKGSWRAHMNVLRTIVERNLTSALILEDDADWDVRIGGQAALFAGAARAFLQPLMADRTTSLASSSRGAPPAVVWAGSAPRTVAPRTGPYGDGWDVLWLGHCGTEAPSGAVDLGMLSADGRTVMAAPPPAPAMRVAIADDATVPVGKHLRPHPFALPDAELEALPPHTRVVHAAGSGTACTQAYAVSARGARRLLWRFGLESMSNGWDLELAEWCGGAYAARDEGAAPPMCVTVQPPLFAQHYGKGGKSDITAPGGGFIDGNREMTPYVRLSVRLNMGKLVGGATIEELVDQWPDD